MSQLLCNMHDLVQVLCNLIALIVTAWAAQYGIFQLWPLLARICPMAGICGHCENSATQLAIDCAAPLLLCTGGNLLTSSTSGIQYQLDEVELGKGGFAHVFMAYEVQTQTPLAIKVCSCRRSIM